MKVLLFIATNVRGFYKMHWSMDSWIHGFKHHTLTTIDGKIVKIVGF